MKPTGRPSVVHGFAGRLYPLCDEHAGGIQVPDGRRSRATGKDPSALEARLLDAYAVEVLPIERCARLFARPAAPSPPPYVPVIRTVPKVDDGDR